MKLNKQTDIALRTLLYLATNGTSRRIFAQEIAEAHDIPLNHLSKVVHKLSLLGYINTFRGRNGGIELGKAKESIFVRDVVEDFEPSFNPEERMIMDKECALSLHLADASDAFLATLGQKHLGDLM